MELTTKPTTTKEDLAGVKYGSCVRYKNTYWILGDTYPDATLVNLEDGTTEIFKDGETWPTVEVVPEANINLYPQQ